MDMRIRMSSASTFQVTDRVRRKTKPREQKTDSEALLEFDVTQTALELRKSMPSKQLFPLANPMTECWDVHCLPFAISKLELIYVMGPSVFDTALNLFEKMEETSHLYLVCRAIGSVFLANMTKSPKAIMGQAKAYSTCLVAVNKAIRGSKEVTSDDLFLSICLLAFYEVSIVDSVSYIRFFLMICLIVGRVGRQFWKQIVSCGFPRIQSPYESID